MGDLDRFLRCFAVVNFDLDVGQTVEFTFPPRKLSQEEEMNVSFHAFPDSMASHLGDTVFVFRMRASRRPPVSPLPSTPLRPGAMRRAVGSPEADSGAGPPRSMSFSGGRGKTPEPIITPEKQAQHNRSFRSSSYRSGRSSSFRSTSTPPAPHPTSPLQPLDPSLPLTPSHQRPPLPGRPNLSVEPTSPATATVSPVAAAKATGWSSDAGAGGSGAATQGTESAASAPPRRVMVTIADAVQVQAEPALPHSASNMSRRSQGSSLSRSFSTEDALHIDAMDWPPSGDDRRASSCTFAPRRCEGGETSSEPSTPRDGSDDDEMGTPVNVDDDDMDDWLVVDDNEKPHPDAECTPLSSPSSLAAWTGAPYLFGYVCFRQKHDPSLPRGFFQKSVVLVTPHPWVESMMKLAAIAGVAYFDNGISALRELCRQVATWPDCRAGDVLEVTALGKPVTLRPPVPPDALPLLSSTTSLAADGERCKAGRPAQAVRTSTPLTDRPLLFQEVNLYTSWSSLIPSLSLLWELVLTGDTLMVLSPTPEQCSAAVLALVSLIAPVTYACDYRPYFTIHDADFKVYAAAAKTKSTPRVILGVTNPFFLKALQHWPTVVAVGRPTHTSRPKTTQARKLGRRKSVSRMELITDYKEKVWSDRKPLFEIDKTLVKQLVVDERIPEAAAVVNDGLLRRYFHDLTRTFLSAYEPYFDIKRPPSLHTHPFTDWPPLEPFSHQDVLRRIAGSSLPNLPGRNKPMWSDVYRRFMQCPNFGVWFEERRARARLEQERCRWEALGRMSIDSILANMIEVQRVDVFLKINAALSRGYEVMSAATWNNLQHHQFNILAMLPDDTRLVLQAKMAAKPRDPSPNPSSPSSPAP